MTIEEKARAYDEALEKVRPLYERAKKDDSSIWATYEHLFPQLAESEDERIRRDIIHYILYKADGVSEEQEHSWIAYLEKQKEQKPAEWSEEDELMRNACITFIKDEKFKGYERSYECIDWLKSLRPSWKPEGQQLDCLRHMINVSTVDKIDKQFVIDLYEQLKKL